MPYVTRNEYVFNTPTITSQKVELQVTMLQAGMYRKTGRIYMNKLRTYHFSD